MDVMVQWDPTEEERAAFARVNAVASPETLESPTREIVTLYGEPTPEYFALALAASVEARKRTGVGYTSGEIHLTAADGAVGEASYRDVSGAIIRRELSIPLTVLKETAAEILAEGGQSIRRLLAGLRMPDWPEGARRALGFQFASAAVSGTGDTLAAHREADAENFSDED